jgi:hypothetical protein
MATGTTDDRIAEHAVISDGTFRSPVRRIPRRPREPREPREPRAEDRVEAVSPYPRPTIRALTARGGSRSSPGRFHAVRLSPSLVRVSIQPA